MVKSTIMAGGRKFFSFLGIWEFVGVLLLPLLFAQSLDPSINDDSIRKLLALPNGVSNQPSLILRSKHVDLVQFYGSGLQSRRGFVLKNGIIRDGLWLDLRNRGDQPWASTSIKLRGPMDITDYNSLVIWVRPSLIKHRLWVGFQDPSWSQMGLAQTRTEAFPAKGLTAGEVVQVVVPFSAFSTDNKFNFKQLSHITFEFGTQSVGNSLFGSLEVFGVAFVKQKKLLASIQIDRPEEEVVAEGAIDSSQKETIAPAKAQPARRAKKVATRQPPMEYSPPELEVPYFEKNEENQALQVPSSILESNQNEAASETTLASKAPAPVPKSIPEPGKKLSFLKKFRGFEIRHTKWVLFGFFLVLLNAFAYFLLRRSRKLINQSASRFLYEIKWPSVFESVASHFMNEKKFWKEVAGLGVRLAWISPFQVKPENTSEKDEYYAENFLHRQIQLAKGAGVDLIPSLCFARTLFHYETFLLNPDLYLTRQVPHSDRHFSDEELRVKYIGYFPVWIPPFWQKKHNLSERLLVAYGKLPGMMPTSDGIQFNLNSPQLRKFAVRLIERFARHSRGVRIEGAAALLNSSMYKYWRIKNVSEEMGGPASEFWEEVIAAVKAKYPHFLFIADGAGVEVAKLRTLGFDFYENDQLRDILINQIRLEKVGNLEYILTGALVSHLDRSIHDINPLLQTNEVALKKQQNLLASLILSLLPGMIQHPGIVGGFDLYQFLNRISKIPVLKHGYFRMLQASSPSILAFSRFDSRTVYVAVANFSLKTQSVSVRLEPFMDAFKEKSMYLFNDFLHGSSFLRDLLAESAREPAMAVLGQDLRDSGLNLTIPGLSLRLLSVSLKQQIAHEPSPSKIHQIR